ncbi:MULTISPECIES: transglutaminase family protein [Rhizobium]|uniref:Transglutaminase family protein n=1 Tax=Rhizobium tropici TaxID=398 RepID=A0A6P1C6C3_RHITR|nr:MULTISPECIES: transglutaminase family protein [Rhizobium]AGB72428.1 transglutaminase domain-containing protein [Rhizobium tropici CIAT 899]MBB4243237.1 transglutaminase-like putative cysteine protease [Rhizobium tropici]MBB5594880.1 transglutaminase-like putative cysteine protease [Rhizobium tropici]MBB6493563.1 transglutaminase-like putative cysteine protease [Rhizobium tropici]NEV11946.1 transglutaminase family protein [Rhizobium tropici]
MLYDLSLHMGYIYDVPASGARHILRVMPLSLPNRQRLIAGSVKITPGPDEQSHFTDFFQHPATSILVREPHERLDIRMQARVQVESQPVGADFSPLLAKLPEEINDCWSIDPSSPHHFLGSSPRLPDTREIADYSRQWKTANLTTLQIAHAVCAQVHKDFVYDTEATTVDTTPREAFRLKRGVCQDFSHVMIIALRSLGIPAGYVSGFLRTIPPPGKERLEGADAMHAWVRVWCGETAGWIELDPTNNIPAGTDHIVVAYGRDYSDVAPVIGVLKSYGNQEAVQAVDVIPLK